MTRTVIALFDNLGKADDAVHALLANGFERERIELQSAEEFVRRSELPPPEQERETVWPAVKSFLDELGITTPTRPGGADHPIERDDAIVMVKAADDRAEAAAELLDSKGALDIEQRNQDARLGRRATGFEPVTSGRTPPHMQEVPPMGDIDERSLASGRSGDRSPRRGARVY
ncbi:MAG TPA: hypothetical protein VF203_01240 [Burkholderiales bacterium]